MYKEELDKALRAYDEAKEQRNALAGQEETPELAEQRDALDGKLDELTVKVEQAEARAAKEAKLEESRAKAGVYQPARTTPRHESALQEILATRGSGVIPFNGALEQRAVNAGTGHNYGNATFQERFITPVLQHDSVLRAGAFILDDPTGNLYNGLTVDPVEGSLVSEGSDLDTSTTTGQARAAQAFIFGGVVKISEDAITDNAANLETLIADKASANVSDNLGGFLLTGTGTNQPQGAVTGAAVAVTASSATGLSKQDVYNLRYSLNNNSGGASWIMHSQTAAYIRGLGDNGWFTNPADDNVEYLLGCPLFTDDNMATIAASAKSIVFGRFNAGYTVRMVGGIDVLAMDTQYREARQVGVRVTVRADGWVNEPKFIKALQHPAS